MSNVTDLILTTATVEPHLPHNHRPLDELNEYLLVKHQTILMRLDDLAAGSKGFQAAVYLAALNYLDLEEFLTVFRNCKWALPDKVMLLYQGEHDDGFTVCVPEGGMVRVGSNVFELKHRRDKR